MRINTTGVELTEPKNYINTAGEFILKITGWDSDGFTPEGREKFKISFIAHTGELHTERFSLNDNMLWKIKRLEVAIGAPEIYEIDDFVGRYVKAEFKTRVREGKTYADVKEWKEADQNKKVLEMKPWPKYDDAPFATDDKTIAEEAELLF